MKILICGLGSIGMRHFSNFKSLGVNDFIIYRTGKSTMPNVSDTAGYPVFYDLAEALKEGPDIAVIANPTSLHIETARACVSAGCHLFIEKPISNNMAGVDDLVSEIYSAKVVSMVTYQFRFHPHLLMIREALTRPDRYGRPLVAHAEWSEFLPDWHPWEDFRRSYAARDDLGGGVFLTQIHPYNYMSQILGSVERINTNLTFTGSLGISVNDAADMHVKYESGCSSHIHVDYLQKPRTHTMKLTTTNGRFDWDCHAHTLNFLHHTGECEKFETPTFERNDMFVSMAKHFLADVEKGVSSGFEVRHAAEELRMLLTSV